MTRDIPEREGLTVEFKSDRGRLGDRDLVATVVCLANTHGGDIFLGVEDDGTVTGLHPEHRNITGMTALIANLTSPSLTVRVETIAAARFQIGDDQASRLLRKLSSENKLQRLGSGRDIWYGPA